MQRNFKSTVLMAVVVMFIFTIALSNQVMAQGRPDLTILKCGPELQPGCGSKE